MDKQQGRTVLVSSLALFIVCFAVQEATGATMNAVTNEGSYHSHTEKKPTEIILSTAAGRRPDWGWGIFNVPVIVECFERSFSDINTLLNQGAQIVVDVTSVVADLALGFVKCETSKCLSDLAYKNLRKTWDAYDKSHDVSSAFRITMENIAYCISDGDYNWISSI